MKKSSALLAVSVVAAIVSAIWIGVHWNSEHESGGAASSIPPKPNSMSAVAEPRVEKVSGKPSEASGEISRILQGQIPKLTPAQIKAFVESRNHDASSLVAAWGLSEDESYLEEAAHNHRDDPEVAAAMLMMTESPEESRKWIETIFRNDPENAAGPLYAARAAFASGDLLSALAELNGVESRPRTDFFTESAADTLIAAYRHAGYGGIEAEWAGLFQVSMPAAGHMSELNKNIAAAMADAYDSGDAELTGMLGKAGMAVASRMGGENGSDYLITQLVSVSMERRILHQLDIFELIPGNEKLVIDRMDELDRKISSFKELIQRYQSLLPELSEAEAREYTRRMRSDGEAAAMRWLVANHKAP